MERELYKNTAELRAKIGEWRQFAAEWVVLQRATIQQKYEVCVHFCGQFICYEQCLEMLNQMLCTAGTENDHRNQEGRI